MLFRAVAAQETRNLRQEVNLFPVQVFREAVFCRHFAAGATGPTPYSFWRTVRWFRRMRRTKAKPKRQKQLRPTKYYIMVIALASAILISLCKTSLMRTRLLPGPLPDSLDYRAFQISELSSRI